MIDQKQDVYQGVLCQHCRQPIPVPAIVVSLEHEAREQVFTLRCRSCDCEHPYRSKDIAEFQGVPKSRLSRAHESKLLRQAQRKTRAAHA